MPLTPATPKPRINFGPWFMTNSASWRRRGWREKPGHTLDATALVHEAYLRLVGARSASKAVDDVLAGAAGSRFDGRRHFFAAAGEAMRRILVESARRKKTAKHGGGMARHDAAADAASGHRRQQFARNPRDP